jgi:nucleoside-diphosphate-sugar epimerase
MRYLVTGGAGFIGSHMVKEIVRRGEYVTVIDSLVTGKKERLKDVMEHIRFVQGDIRDSDLLRKEMKGIDYVIHLAALISVVESMEKPDLYHEVNVEGTRKVLEAAKLNDVKCFVMPSSCAVYGSLKTVPFKESMKASPTSPYGQSKLDIEKLCREYYDKQGLKTIALRYFNVFGPGQEPGSAYSGVISIFIKKLLSNEIPFIFGDGKQTREFVYVQNIVEATLLACEAEKGFGEPYNIGTEEEISVNALYKMICKIMKKDVKPKYEPARKGEMKRAGSDCTKAKKVLGYSPKISFEQGLKETVAYFVAEKNKEK